MAYTLSLYDPILDDTYDITDRTQQLLTNEALDRDVTTFTINLKDIYLQHIFNRLTVNKDSSLFLSGLVLNQDDQDGGSLDYKLTSLVGEDWGHLLQKRIVAEIYLSTGAEAGKPDAIIKHLLGKYATEFTTINVDTCNVVIDEIQFQYITLRDAIDQIMELLPGWHWYIDRNKDFHFFNTYESDGITFTQNNVNLKTLKVLYTGQEHVNRVWIVGKKQASATAIDEYYTGDGTQRYFKLAYEPSDTEIYVNGVKKDSSLEQNDNGARDFLISKVDRVFYTPSYASPFSGTIRANYKPIKQFIDRHDNTADQALYGILESVIKDINITNKLQSRRYGMAEVKKQSTIQRVVTFRATSDVFSVQIGQRCPVNIQSDYWDVQGNFLVKSVKRDISPQVGERVYFELEEIA